MKNKIVLTATLVRQVNYKQARRIKIQSRITLKAEDVGNMPQNVFHEYVVSNFPGWSITNWQLAEV